MRNIPKRNYRLEESEKAEISHFRFFVMFIFNAVAAVVFLPHGSNAFIFLIFFAPLAGTVLWNLLFPPKSEFEKTWAKEIADRAARMQEWGNE